MKTTTGLFLPVLGLLAALPTWGAQEDTPGLSDQQEGMRENLEDSVVLEVEQEQAPEDEPDRDGWLPENLRVILPENLQEMHRLDVSLPWQDEGSKGGDDSPASSTRDSTAATPEIMEKPDKLMEFSRLPLTIIQERVPFLTRRKIIFFGRLEPELVRYTSGVLEEDRGFQVRRFRLGLAGRFIPWPNWNYKIEMDLTDGENTLADAYLSWHSHKWGTFRIGNQKVAQTLSGQTSSISNSFMERPLPVLAFTLQRRLGLGYDLHKSHFGINTTIFATDLNKNVGSEGYAVRGYFNPTRTNSHIFHLGASFLKFSSDNDAQVRARPESNRTDTRLINTGVYSDVDTSSATGLELAGAWGPVTMRSEFSSAQWGGKKTSGPKFDGWYVQGSWFPTGEMARYIEGKFIRPRVISNRGAWELALRYSTTDLNDKEVEGGWEDNISLGINWYSKKHWRVMANIIKVDADGPQGEQDPWILQTRLQYYF